MTYHSSIISIDASRLLGLIEQLGQIGLDGEDRLVRLAASDADKQGRDALVSWMREANLDVAVDKIGNIFGIWRVSSENDLAPIMVGSHIDTVINAGEYDGCYGVLSGIEVIQTLQKAGFVPSRPIVVAAFTNEEGVRYTPDMMGSLVHAGGLSVEDALSAIGTDSTILGEELERIGYAGTEEPGFLKPHAYVELHIEQGPVLERERTQIGAVEDLQGISWQKITIEGVANHTGTTPISMRSDAGYAASRVISFLRDRATSSQTPTVATVGCISFEPNAINVIPSRAVFTVDLRDPNEHRLQAEEAALSSYLKDITAAEGVKITTDRMARFEPVTFDANIVKIVESAAKRRGLSSKRMTSGAGHDAQMIARICPAAMIFVPSIGGISHNPREFTPGPDLVAGANVLLDVISNLVSDQNN